MHLGTRSNGTTPIPAGKAPELDTSSPLLVQSSAGCTPLVLEEKSTLSSRNPGHTFTL